MGELTEENKKNIEMSEIQVISSTEEIAAKETKKVTTKKDTSKKVTTKKVTTNEIQLNTPSKPLPKPRKRKPVHAFKVPDFCKVCREFCLNLKFHNKDVHGATCELCLSLFENQEKLDKHHKQWHKKWLIMQSNKKKEEYVNKKDELKAPEKSVKVSKVSDNPLKNAIKVTPIGNEVERKSEGLLDNENQENKENVDGPVTPIIMSPIMSPKIMSQKLSQVSISGSDENNNDVAKKQKKRQSSIKSFFDVIVID